MLTKQEINKLIDAQRLVATPLLDRKAQIHPGRIDFRLGVMFMIPSYNRSASVDAVKLTRAGVPLDQYQNSYYIPLGKSLVLHPGDTIIGSTLEYFVLPLDVSGIIAVRSSWSRLGLSVAPGMIVDPGNKGCLTLELANEGRIPIELYPGSRIGHLLLFPMTAEEEETTSRYSFAIGPQYSKLDKDPEMSFLGESPVVIGITGQLNAGKTDVANYLASRLGFVLRSPSMILKQLLKEDKKESLTQDEKYLRKIGLRGEHGDEFFAVEALREALKDSPKGVILDGLAHPKELEYLKKLPAFHLLAVCAEEEWRFQRYNISARTGGRKTISKEDFLKIDRRQNQSLDLKDQYNSHADDLDTCIETAKANQSDMHQHGHDTAQNDDDIERWILMHGLGKF